MGAEQVIEGWGYPLRGPTLVSTIIPFPPERYAEPKVRVPGRTKGATPRRCEVSVLESLRKESHSVGPPPLLRVSLLQPSVRSKSEREGQPEFEFSTVVVDKIATSLESSSFVQPKNG